MLYVGRSFAFSGLTIFGDSLSDTGNVLVYSFWPYYENRISNGPVAVDVLAAHYGLEVAPSRHLYASSGGGNFAVAGANAAGSDIEDLLPQYDAFSARNPGVIDGEALYVIMIGGNDLRDARDRASAAQANAVVDAAVNRIRDIVQVLVDRGARHVLVVNAPDIRKIPETREKAAGNPGILARAQEVVLRFNDRLAAAVAALEGDTRKLVLLDLYALLNSIVANPGRYGMDNTDEACFDTDSLSLHPECDFDRFVFFDNLHPTAATHGILGRAMITALEDRRPPGLIWFLPLLLD